MSITRNPVVFVMSILGALQALAASVAFIDVVPVKVAALIMAVICAAQFGVQFWVRGQVTPLSAIPEPLRFRSRDSVE